MDRASIEDAVRVGFNNYVNFEGRAARRQYWLWVLFAVVVSIVTSIVGSIIGVGSILNFIAALALFLPGLAYAVRRMHDIGKPGWYLLIGLIPFLGWIYVIYLAVQPSQPQTNAWGAVPA
ncbi:MAG: DUF805 domain-containing protein [Chloroflexi bacterium]|nr:DUF805 domain-containing protein [Chloroflexota bacterium]MDA1147002.1 DUF805 domain-containing protein [Chloroflexota bacterium]